MRNAVLCLLVYPNRSACDTDKYVS